jgi:hypothetical protein
MTETMGRPMWTDKDYPDRMDYRVLVESDGNDGELHHVVQAFYRKDADLPFTLSEPVPAMGDYAEGLRRDLQAMLAATERPALILNRDGSIAETED